jgi:hypothetical protein
MNSEIKELAEKWGQKQEKGFFCPHFSASSRPVFGQIENC